VIVMDTLGSVFSTAAAAVSPSAVQGSFTYSRSKPDNREGDATVARNTMPAAAEDNTDPHTAVQLNGACASQEHRLLLPQSWCC
jgi:hypothetical protein